MGRELVGRGLGRYWIGKVNQLRISCHSICPCVRDAMWVFRSWLCCKLSETILFTCLFARFISLPLTSSILNFSWSEALGMWSMSVVPFINRRALFWNFCSLSRWPFLLLIVGSGAYSNVGLICRQFRLSGHMTLGQGHGQGVSQSKKVLIFNMHSTIL